MATNRAPSVLIDEIRSRAARTTDTVLITEAFVLAQMNEAQLDIAKRAPGHLDLFVKDETTFEVGTWSTTATTVTVGSRTDRVVTLTAAGHGLVVGDIATVADVAGSTSFDGDVEILSVATNDITYRNNLADDTATSFGTIVKKSDKYFIDLSTLSVKAFSVHDLWILNGSSTRPGGLEYVSRKNFDNRYGPIGVRGEGEPKYYTRRGQKLIFDSPISSTYSGLPIRVDYTKYPTDLANDSTVSILRDSDKGLIWFALAEVFEAISFSQTSFQLKAQRARQTYSDWLDDYVEAVEIQTEYGFED